MVTQPVGLVMATIGLLLLFGTLARITGYRLQQQAMQDRPGIYDAPENVEPEPVMDVFPMFNLGFNDPLRHGRVYVQFMGDYVRVTAWRYDGQDGFHELELGDHWVRVGHFAPVWFCRELGR